MTVLFEGVTGSRPMAQRFGAMLDRHDPERFAVVLHLTMQLRCADPPHEVILLSGGLTPDGIRTDGLLSHLEPGGDTRWPVDQVSDV